MKAKFYSNSLPIVNIKAKQVAQIICSYYGIQKQPSAFKRNDALSRAMGYKSHSDLVSQSKSNTAPISISPNYPQTEMEKFKDAVSKEFASVFSDLKENEVRYALSRTLAMVVSVTDEENLLIEIVQQINTHLHDGVYDRFLIDLVGCTKEDNEEVLTCLLGFFCKLVVNPSLNENSIYFPLAREVVISDNNQLLVMINPEIYPLNRNVKITVR
ncbi:hypothetical protein V9N52_004350 [Vibrio navarrensis]